MELGRSGDGVEHTPEVVTLSGVQIKRLMNYLAQHGDDESTVLRRMLRTSLSRAMKQEEFVRDIVRRHGR